ncbi:hypothetical protein CKM354_000301200 [Cercospora kikuchii]|uniref:Protein kinase domain-containing protein n=1 Tax=Cercospora kikuchii TaxID=84275 RepID=A0A9P3CE01_9PEZI|nr:uncharacterized protein CKM354_000301200 [Cercospora kikuchii]GIZ39637.1 hypothetical protein CKM354_000301200 [Cercospora kikuchii]
MQFVNHGDLQQHVGSPMPEKEVQMIVSQVLGGLACMHEFGYAHRDLKPANLLVVRTGPRWQVKITDFGLSKRIIRDLTSLRTQCGTQGYMAPEMLALVDEEDDEEDDDSVGERAYSYTPSVDIWATGVIAFQLLTAQLPFHSAKRLKSYVRGKSGFPTEALGRAGASTAGRAWIQECMAPSPRARPDAKNAQQQSWPTLIEDLSTANESLQVPLRSATIASGSWNTDSNRSTVASSSQRTSSQRPAQQPVTTASVVKPAQDSGYASGLLGSSQTAPQPPAQQTIPNRTYPSQDQAYRSTDAAKPYDRWKGRGGWRVRDLFNMPPPSAKGPGGSLERRRGRLAWLQM